MTVIRTLHNRENPYVMLNKSVIQNKKLSLKARGLWALLMSYPNDWKFYVKVLIKECKEGRKVIYNCIDELIESKLMVKITTFNRKKNGKMCGGGVEYIVFEFPLSEEEAEGYQKNEEGNFEKPSDNEYDRNSTFGIPGEISNKSMKKPSDNEYDRNSTYRHAGKEQLLSNKATIPKKQQQQQASPKAAAAVVSIHPILKAADIPEEDKQEISRKYSEETVINAVGWATDPGNPPKKSLVASIKFACKKNLSFQPIEIAKPDLKKELSEEEKYYNKEKVKKFIKENWSLHEVKINVDANVEFAQVKNDKIYYNDPQFGMLFEHACRKII